MKHSIPFNKPYVTGKELDYISEAVGYGNVSGDGFFTKACSDIMEERFSIPHVLMTTSCTSALEMAAMLCDFSPGDEVILPSYTFVSTANAMAREGATPVFVDVRSDTLNLDEEKIEAAITSRTKAIVPVHYAGVSCEMDRIMEIANRHDLIVIEDAAQGVNSYYRSEALGTKALGSIGHLGTYSFHETKNYICGEGGALCVNDSRFFDRAEILRDKGTNRKRFIRGEVDKYTWVDTGSSYGPSEIVCAFLYAQLDAMDDLLKKRKEIFDRYFSMLAPLRERELVELPWMGETTRISPNFHMFYLLLKDQSERDALLQYMNDQGVQSVFHYVPLHSSPRAKELGCHVASLPVTDSVSGRLLRLPFFYELTEKDQNIVVRCVYEFFKVEQPA